MWYWSISLYPGLLQYGPVCVSLIGVPNNPAGELTELIGPAYANPTKQPTKAVLIKNDLAFIYYLPIVTEQIQNPSTGVFHAPCWRFIAYNFFPFSRSPPCYFFILSMSTFAMLAQH